MPDKTVHEVERKSKHDASEYLRAYAADSPLCVREGQRENQRRMLENAAGLYGAYLSRYRRSRAAYQIYFFRFG